MESGRASPPYWWSPQLVTTATTLAATPTAAATLPADVALWLAEIRHGSDLDDTLWTIHGHSAPFLASSSSSAPDFGDTRATFPAGGGVGAVDMSPPGVAADLPWAETEEGVTSPPADVGAFPSPSPSDNGHCAACQRLVWNPAYRSPGPAPASDGSRPSASARELAWCCGPNCPDGRAATKFGKLCQNAIDELHAVLLGDGDASARDEHSSGEEAVVAVAQLPRDDDLQPADCEGLAEAPGGPSDRSEVRPASPGCCPPSLLQLATAEVRAHCQGALDVLLPDQMRLWFQCEETKCCSEVTPLIDDSEELSVSRLESMIPSVHGMEDVQCCLAETLEKEYHDFYSLCDDTSSMIEETLQYFMEQPSCRILKTQQSQSTVASSLSDDVFTTCDIYSEEGEEDRNSSVKQKLSQSGIGRDSFDVNSIFDNGMSVPVAPPRLNKMKRLRLSSSSSSKSVIENTGITGLSSSFRVVQSENENTVTELLPGDNSCRERKVRSCYSEREQFSSSATLSTSLQNLAFHDINLNAASGDISLETTEVYTDESAVCGESGSNSSLLEVNIPTVKPVSSFVFPSNVETSLRLPSLSGSRHSLRSISSTDDLSRSLCDSLLLDRPRKGSGSSDIAAWKHDLQRSPFFSPDDDYLPGDEWFSSTDGKGRVYFFEENSSVSTWTLPDIVVGSNEEAAPENDPLLDTGNLSLRNQDGEKKSRVGKARSLFLTDQKHKETTSKTSSIPRNWLQLYGLDKDVLKYGYMNRTKITENGKKMSKKWASAYVVLTEDALCFYKDLKNSQHSVGLQPELSMQLFDARLEPGIKFSSRKHIFLITSGSLQLLCECESGELASQWRSAISNAIARLSRLAATPSIKIPQDKPKTASIGRSKSLQVKNREGTLEDAVSTEEQQMKIRDRLKKFFNRRPTREILASKGIYKDEPVFDSHLEKVCPSHPPYIPDFVRLCVASIESKEENMKTDGLYRASGNLSHVQKIRLQVDQNNLSVLESEEDVHVLTGALKLFFRELKEPLIPYELFNEAIDAGGMNGSKKEKIKMFRDIVKKLPPQNHDTLKFLLRHLRRVTQFEEFNRMHVPNLAIVFGPTLMWRQKEYHQTMAIEYMQQNLVIEFFLQQYDDIFR